MKKIKENFNLKNSILAVIAFYAQNMYSDIAVIKTKVDIIAPHVDASIETDKNHGERLSRLEATLEAKVTKKDYPEYTNPFDIIDTEGKSIKNLVKQVKFNYY